LVERYVTIEINGTRQRGDVQGRADVTVSRKIWILLVYPKRTHKLETSEEGKGQRGGIRVGDNRLTSVYWEKAIKVRAYI